MMKKRCCRKKQTKNYYWILFWWKKYQKFVETFTFIKLYVVILTKRTEKKEKKNEKEMQQQVQWHGWEGKLSDLLGQYPYIGNFNNEHQLDIFISVFVFRFKYYDNDLMHYSSRKLIWNLKTSTYHPSQCIWLQKSMHSSRVATDFKSIFIYMQINNVAWLVQSSRHHIWSVRVYYWKHWLKLWLKCIHCHKCDGMIPIDFSILNNNKSININNNNVKCTCTMRHRHRHP